MISKWTGLITERLAETLLQLVRSIFQEKKGIYTFYLVYKFSNKKFSKANLKVDYAKEKEKYILAWDSYLRGLKIPKKRSNHSLYYRSMFTLRVHEDKINPGAMIASLSNPWGEEVQHSPSSKHGGYHLVWHKRLVSRFNRDALRR